MVLIGRQHITAYIRRNASAHTALALWEAITRKARWQTSAEVLASFPATKFVTPKMANFSLVGVNCAVTTQIAFNTGTLIVLGVTAVESQPTRSQ